MTNTTTFSEEIKSNVVYNVGLAYFLKQLATKMIVNQHFLVNPNEEIYIITSSKHNMNDIPFEEWYMSNQYHMYWFNKKFIGEIWNELLEKKKNGSLHLIHVDGYFPICNCNMKGDMIIKKVAEINKKNKEISFRA